MVNDDETRVVLDKFPTLQRTVEEVLTWGDLRDKLAARRPLRIKYGVDVTAPFLHIGHAVNLWAMREAQEQGHRVVFLIGDFTTRIGDPTGKAKTRPTISAAQIERDAEDYVAQVGTILHTDPQVFEVRRNSEWWEKMPLHRFLELISLSTYAKLVQRDMFRRRIEQGVEIHMHEMLYPLLQGYDSYALESDLTIVGTDQLFNESMGRFYQERLGAAPQVVMTTAITPGIDGREKQSKSLGNYIALNDTPRDKFGKAMSLPDSLVADFLRVYTLVPLDEIEDMEAAVRAGRLNPMDMKRVLSRALVARYHSEKAAQEEDEWFSATFSRRSQPEDVPVVVVEDPDSTLLEILRRCLPTDSSSELRRLVQQGAVRVDDEKLEDVEERRAVADGQVIRVGKRRWFRIVFGRTPAQRRG